MRTQGRPYPMKFMNAELQNVCLKDMDTLSISDHHYLISKYSDTNIAFLFWQATEIRNFLDQDIQGMVQE